MGYKYWLPDKNGTKQEYDSGSNSVVIIGANGSGKSKLGAWIEQQDFQKTHRIGAQRNLNFRENIQLKSYSTAENLVLFGTEQADDPNRSKKGGRWGWHENVKYTTTLLDDFENVLAALISLKNNENDRFIDLYKKAIEKGLDRPSVPVTVIDELQDIWNSIFPQRELIFEDSKFYAGFNNSESTYKYSANQMSDGERSVLYLVSQVLCVPQNMILIIDEPEIHLHRSIMNQLWMSLEGCRPDCLFVYITHDIQFATDHTQSEKIWIKKYDGQNWELERVETNNLPEELLYEILGSRKNVLFVEGERNSFDRQVYSGLYPNYHVIACGSCSQVIARTRAFRSNPALHDCDVYGIIDRDYRSDYEIQKLKEDHIYSLKVAEVENLFITRELIQLMAANQGNKPEKVFDAVQTYVIETRFANQIESQICESTVAQIKYKLSSLEISNKNEQDAKNSFRNAINSLNFESFKQEQEKKYKDALESRNYEEIIKVFNQKNLAGSIGHFMGIVDRSYCSTIIALLHGGKHDAIVDALKPYLPEEIPN